MDISQDYTEAHRKAVTQALLDCSRSMKASVLFPVMVPEAAGIVVTDPYAFSLAACLDRGTKADVIWTIPFDIKQKLGHLDPFKIYDLSLAELTHLFTVIPHKPRYVNDAPRTTRELTRLVVEECGGDASRIWVGKRAAEVKQTFLSIHGVGNGIANLAVILIEKAFPVRFGDIDRPAMDIKPDLHTKRVLYRLGVSESEEESAAIEATRRMNPGWPGELDGALWWIGRNWCRAIDPDCTDCVVKSVCARRK